MENDEDPEVDIEQLLQGLLALSGDEELRLDVVEKLAQRTNLSAEDAEALNESSHRIFEEPTACRLKEGI